MPCVFFKKIPVPCFVKQFLVIARPEVLEGYDLADIVGEWENTGLVSNLSNLIYSNLI